MASRRVARVAEQIQQEIASLILFEARDPRLTTVTITNARVSPDLSVARLYYLPTLPDADRAGLAEALDRARSYLRRELGKRLKLRRVPELHFHLDEVVEHGRRMDRVFNALHDGDDATSPGEGADDLDEDADDLDEDADDLDEDADDLDEDSGEDLDGEDLDGEDLDEAADDDLDASAGDGDASGRDEGDAR